MAHEGLSEVQYRLLQVEVFAARLLCVDTDVTVHQELVQNVEDYRYLLDVVFQPCRLEHLLLRVIID